MFYHVIHKKQNEIRYPQKQGIGGINVFNTDRSDKIFKRPRDVQV